MDSTFLIGSDYGAFNNSCASFCIKGLFEGFA